MLNNGEIFERLACIFCGKKFVVFSFCKILNTTTTSGLSEGGYKN